MEPNAEHSGTPESLPASASEGQVRHPWTGKVESVSGPKTIRVAIETLVKHPMYGKYLRQRTRLLVHDEQGIASVGDMVEIVQCRPVSKRKSWRLVGVLRSTDNPMAAAGGEGQ